MRGERDYVNEGWDPDDYDEPENRCERCGAFTRKMPAVTKSQFKDEPDFTIETVDFSCKRCGHGECDELVLTPWGNVEVDYLRDHEGGWIYDRTEIERTVKLHNPHKWPKCSYCREVFESTPQSKDWRVSDRPTCYPCFIAHSDVQHYSKERFQDEADESEYWQSKFGLPV